MKQWKNTVFLRNADRYSEIPRDTVRLAIVPEQQELAEYLRQHGWFMIDRTMQATISLKKSIDFHRFCRIPVEKKDALTPRIYEISEAAFLWDTRFYTQSYPLVEDICQQIISYVDLVQSYYVCCFKDEIAGFLEVVPDRDKPNTSAEIRLAAVDEKYRPAGVALSMYAGVAEVCREKGIQKLWGRISSRNMSVLNLYVALGAYFSLPLDIYVRR
ncbi:GNAT family N-acetyltransferase [Anaerovibrio lipolyticus]|jgi:ribosomal protein S18 acetylase RimI-like enzyme|uniref:GNAT family N-acetyltransferase n=1 Tax=Anaerovibrio lipolyticus TaxID=82374 RepID=UPI00048769BB|nr:GNAT family N-acetyltransferase [Anaerovibrio lipolyticus]